MCISTPPRLGQKKSHTISTVCFEVDIAAVFAIAVFAVVDDDNDSSVVTIVVAAATATGGGRMSIAWNNGWLLCFSKVSTTTAF
mmetsp:Transcript_7290/g.12089  ORF Transcript_7290/g.12089 Transcript_7290/m.12089 type:complete len:84 (-) Transcript_7290:83-334(-)